MATEESRSRYVRVGVSVAGKCRNLRVTVDVRHFIPGSKLVTPVTVIASITSASRAASHHHYQCHQQKQQKKQQAAAEATERQPKHALLQITLRFTVKSRRCVRSFSHYSTAVGVENDLPW